MQTADNLPNQTIYISNLIEKINKEELKKCLYTIFNQFGKVLDVVCLKTKTLRGQAWIVFADVTCATNALRAMNGFPFFDKPMRIQYGKGKSDAIAKLDGTFEVHQAEKKRKKQAAGKDQPRPEKRPAVAQAAQQPLQIQQAPATNQPHNKLFVQGLPEDTQESMVATLFQQVQGYLETRMVPNRPGMAFVEYDSATNAGMALDMLNGFQIRDNMRMVVSYANQ